MSFFSGAGGMLGGAAISTLGGILGGASSNRAARQWQDEQARDTAINRNRMGYALFGKDPFEGLMTAGNYTAGTPESRDAAYKKFIDSIGGPVTGQMGNITKDASDMSGGIRNGYYADTQRLRGAGEDAVNRVQSAYKQGADASLASYDQAAGGLMSRVKDYGKGQQAIIDDDAQRLERALNLKSKAALYGSGMGNSTRVATHVTNNALETERARRKQSADLADNQVDRETGLGRSILSERTGAQRQMLQASNDALERGTQNNLGYERSRSEGLTSLDIQNMERQLGLKQGQLQTIMSAISGTTQGTSTPYIAPYSPTATGLTGAGNALAQYSSMQQMLEMMNAMRGGGATGAGNPYQSGNMAGMRANG